MTAIREHEATKVAEAFYSYNWTRLPLDENVFLPLIACKPRIKTQDTSEYTLAAGQAAQFLPTGRMPIEPVSVENARPSQAQRLTDRANSQPVKPVFKIYCFDEWKSKLPSSLRSQVDINIVSDEYIIIIKSPVLNQAIKNARMFHLLGEIENRTQSIALEQIRTTLANQGYSIVTQDLTAAFEEQGIHARPHLDSEPHGNQLAGKFSTLISDSVSLGRLRSLIKLATGQTQELALI